MAANQGINFFDLDNYAGGGVFEPGPYQIEKARFTYYDFNGKAKNGDALCMMQVLWPLVDGKPVTDGDPIIRYWPLNAETRDGDAMIEPFDDVKGEKGCWKRIRFTEKAKKESIYKGSDFFMYFEQLAKLPFDADAAANDLTALDGLNVEYELKAIAPKVKTAVEEAEEGKDAKDKKKYPKEVVIPVSLIIQTKGGKSTSAKKDEKKDAKPASSSSSKKGKEPTNSELILEYLEAEVLTEDNEDGTPLLTHKLAISRHFAKEKGLGADKVKEVMAEFNDSDTLNSLLNTAGWELDGRQIKKQAE